MLTRLLDTALDRTIVGGYSRLGYLARSATWSGAQADPAPDALRGRVALVTGGSAGLGLATVTGLARLGATVHLVVLDADRGEAARARVAAAVPGASLQVTRCDVADLDDVRAVAPALIEAGPDVLVHNAGVLPPRRSVTAQGHETTLATHVLGPHLLTALLADALTDRAGRVLFVSSGGMYAQRLRFDEPQPYDGTAAYARTKRMQVVLAGLWAERLPGVAVHSVHPGWAATPGLTSSLPRFGALLGPLLRTAEQGADTTVWLAAAPDTGTGRFWHDRAPRPEHYLPLTREDAAGRAELWRRCTELTGEPA